MTEQPFRLRCPKCLNSMVALRDEHDPEDATVCEIICPSCDDGDRHAPRYFRCDGTETLWRPEWAAQGMQLREDSRSEVEGEARQPGPPTADAPNPSPVTPPESPNP